MESLLLTIHRLQMFYRLLLREKLRCSSLPLALCQSLVVVSVLYDQSERDS